MTATSDREILLTRDFDAPRELVFRAWTDHQHLARWWGPKGFTSTTREFELRPGGAWRFVLHGPDGVDYENRVVYDEIVSPERLVYTHDSGEDEDPGRFRVTVTFADRGGRTALTMRLLFLTAEARNRAVEEYGGIERGNETLDSLAAHLEEMT